MEWEPTNLPVSLRDIGLMAFIAEALRTLYRWLLYGTDRAWGVAAFLTGIVVTLVVMTVYELAIHADYYLRLYT